MPCSGWGLCVFATGDCACVAGRVGPACGACAANYTLVNDACVFLPGSLTASCYNGVMDGMETGVDCGGSVCPACKGKSGITLVIWFVMSVVGLALLLVAAFGYKYWRDLRRVTAQRRGKERVRVWPRGSLVQVTPLQSPVPVRIPSARTNMRLFETPTPSKGTTSTRVGPRTTTPRASGITVPGTSKRVWGGEQDPAAIRAVTPRHGDPAKRTAGAAKHVGIEKDDGLRPAATASRK